jgi:hypothetical protein
MRITALVPTHHLPEESMAWITDARNVFDEVIVLIDQKRATPGTVARAEKVATNVVRNNRDMWYDPDRFSLLAGSNSDWIFILEYDEQLSPEWQQQDRWREILETTRFTHFWIPRRWMVSGDQYIASSPWCHDAQLRLFRNNLEGTAFPTKLHDVIRVPGPGACFQNLSIHHHVLWLLSRAMREDKVRHYEQLRPDLGEGHYYLYEDYSPSTASLPKPAKLDLKREIRWVDKLSPEEVIKVSLEVGAVPRKVRVSEMFELNVEVTNATSVTIHSYPPLPVHLAYHWIEKATRRMFLFDGNRTKLSPCVGPAESVRYRMMVMAPNQPGEYILQTTMVQEGVCWFEDVSPENLQEFILLVTAAL